jgi:hypothetical protein
MPRTPRAGATRPTALITGASSGIGEALARRFAQGGHDLVLVARSIDRLKALADELAAAHGVKARVQATDLSRPEAAAELAASLRRARRRVDVLVNCAGVLQHGAFVDMPAAQLRGMIDLNVGALTAMLAQFVPPMVRRGGGRVLNVASISAFQPVPSLATYAATKAYVLSLSESLAEELQGTGVTVTALCPGITATPMLSSASRASPQLRKLPAMVVGTPAEVADEGFEACQRGEVIRIPGTLNAATVAAGRVLPKWLLRRVSGEVVRRMK